MNPKVITMQMVDSETHDIIGDIKFIKQGKGKYLLGYDGSVFMHESLEMTDIESPCDIAVPFHSDPGSQVSIFFFAGEYRIYDLNMNLIDSAPMVEWLDLSVFDGSHDIPVGDYDTWVGDSLLDPYDVGGCDFLDEMYEDDMYRLDEVINSYESKHGV